MVLKLMRNSKHILNAQVSIRAPCCKKFFDVGFFSPPFTPLSPTASPRPYPILYFDTTHCDNIEVRGVSD